MTNLLHQMLSFRDLTAAVFGLLLIGAAGFLSLNHLKAAANDIVYDTLPGLSCAGQTNAHLAQGFNHSLLLLADSPDKRHRLRQQIETDHRVTSDFLLSYKAQIFTTEDESLFQEMIKCRADYLSIRERVFNLAEANQRSNALVLFQTELLPAYDRYRRAGDRIFAYNMREGRARGESITAVCTLT